jgi:hypothetical protein
MSWLLVHADHVLRGRRSITPEATGSQTLLHLLALLVFFGLFYGAVMGSFGGVTGPRALQPVYSGVKVPLLLLVTFALSLPS